jgi:hypothetical protein
MGFVEGLNNKIRVLQRRAFGLRDEEGSGAQNPHHWLAGAVEKRSLMLPAKNAKAK